MPAPRDREEWTTAVRSAHRTDKGYGEEVTEVPDADKFEQIRPAILEDGEDDADPAPPEPGDDVPEADAVEQSIEVPIDEDDYA